MSEDILMKLENVGVKYLCQRSFRGNQYHWALNDVSLEIHRGDVLGIIGKNGAGKSTLLRVISGVIKPDGGSILSFGNKVEILALKSGMNMRLTGRENIILGGVLRGKSLKSSIRDCDAIADYSGIGKFIDFTVNKYSTGMQARLGFAISKDADPDILLLDEVVGVGDAEFKSKSRNIVIDKIKNGKGVVIASHSIKTINEYCNKLIWLDEGNVVCSGLKDDVLEYFKNQNAS